ncbi:hypothetical protein BDZ97DRAFT_1659134 [Flammula alnicola]|nr:hypothetical protein BDZ97DRAFT_1659134 [Flammula alnicola]
MPLDTAEVDLDPEEVLSENEERAHRPVFRDANNFPIGFFFHKSVKEPSRRALKRDIEKHGGIVLNTDKGADTVLISPLYERRMLQNAYNAIDDPSLRKVYVEYTPFIQHCIREKEFYHRPDITGMSGVPAGRRRNEYTAEDDERLCQYLSRILPDKESGGRQGLKVYQALLEAMPKEYSWAKRHTPESWKERYKKNASNFDAWIAEMVKIDPPSKKQLWHEDRRKTHNANKRRRQYVYTDEEEEEDLQREQSVQSEEEERNQTDEEDYVPPARKRRRSENVPHRAQPRAKRPRIARQSDYQDSPPRRSRKSMGKERALEQGEDQEVEEELSYEGK